MDYKQMILDDEEGFIDLVLPIHQVSKKFLGGYTIECRGIYNDKLVGLRFVVKKGVTIQSLGECSDTFIQTLASLYGVEVSNVKMKQQMKVKVASLRGELRDISRDIVKLKCFFHTDDEDLYAELYINFDVNNNIVEIKEKDDEYRANIIKSFSE